MHLLLGKLEKRKKIDVFCFKFMLSGIPKRKLVSIESLIIIGLRFS